jgi:hypothetical protein
VVLLNLFLSNWISMLLNSLIRGTPIVGVPLDWCLLDWCEWHQRQDRMSVSVESVEYSPHPMIPDDPVHGLWSFWGSSCLVEVDY